MVFEQAEEYPTTEAYLPRCPTPVSAYGFSKLTGEVYCRAAHDEHGLPFTICRPFNAYGPGEMPEDEPGIAHAVPDLIRKALRQLKPLPIFGDGDADPDAHPRRRHRGRHRHRHAPRPTASTRTSTSPPRDELTVAEIAAHLLGGGRQRPGGARPSSTCRASRSTSCAAGRASRRRRSSSAGRRGSTSRDGIARTAAWLREQEGVTA